MAHDRRAGLEGVRIRSAADRDLDGVMRLLRGAGLPTAGVQEAFSHFRVAEAEGRLLGVAGLEVHGLDGVLRSVAVDPGSRGTGVGARLVEATLAAARAASLRRLYLLTTTAEDYFPRHGFRRITREEAPAAVRGSIEFREACPASAVAMILELE